MTNLITGCRKCRQTGIKLCSKGPKCVLEKRTTTPGQHGKRSTGKKLSEYGKQLKEKQKVKMLYGVLEKQFRRFFQLAVRQKGVTGENLLSLLERRLDNVIFRLKLASSRIQARQMVVHGHIYVNGKRVKSPSFLVGTNDVVSISERSTKNAPFLEKVVDRRLNMGIRVPEWLELQKKDRQGVIIRLPERTDVTTPIEEHMIVELYSK